MVAGVHGHGPTADQAGADHPALRIDPFEALPDGER
jgi:hypothetical protein